MTITDVAGERPDELPSGPRESAQMVVWATGIENVDVIARPNSKQKREIDVRRKQVGGEDR